MKITILDLNTLTRGDLDFSPLDKLGETRYYNVLPEDQIIDACKDADAILINKAQITGEIMDELPDLKYIGLFATGYNNVDLDAADAHHISVVNVPGYSTNAVAQHAFAFILMHATSMPQYNNAVHRGEWIYSDTFSFFPYSISELAGKTLGIVGFGNIGKKIAEIGKAFGMNVIFHNRSNVTDTEFEQVDLKRLFRSSDYLSLHCPLNSETKELVNRDTISLMKPSAFLVNTSRGGVVDSFALADALNNEVIAGAGIDVLPVEPMEKDDPLFTAKNCIITPHIGWAAIEARKRCVEIVIESLRSWINGNPRFVVNNPDM